MRASRYLVVKKVKIVVIALLIVGFVALAAWYLHGLDIPVLNPKGPIGDKERQLMIIAALLSLIVVVPVYLLTFGIIWKYREGNKKAKYTPEFDHHRGIETIWWAIPCAIILVLAIITWNSTHELDPFKSADQTKKSMRIQVVSLDWKWLFIYPDEHIATVNYVQFPENTPVDFEITSDTVMNSFWIPSLGGQIYAMPGMVTHLNLEASGVGDYNGASANISGSGFAGMKFVARSSVPADFNSWLQSIKKTPNKLDIAAYAKLAEPSKNNPPAYYSSSDADLYDTIVMKYMMPDSTHQMSGMGM